MEKKGQITLFIIFGIIFIFITMFFLLSQLRTITEPEIRSSVDSKTIKLFAESCIKSTLEQGLFDVGYANLQTLENYMNNNIPICTNGFTAFQGVKITEKGITSEIYLTLNNHTIITNIKYPLTIKKQSSISKISDFYLSYDLESEINLQTINGITQSQTSVNSQNNVAALNIPPGVSATLNGNSINSIDIVMVDSTYNNNPLLGSIIYDFGPDGATFNPAITLTIEYDESDLPINLDENNMTSSPT